MIFTYAQIYLTQSKVDDAHEEPSPLFLEENFHVFALGLTDAGKFQTVET
jgi:hypothetical protein